MTSEVWFKGLYFYESINGFNFRSETVNPQSYFHFPFKFDNYCSFEKPTIIVKQGKKNLKKDCHVG